MTVGRRLPPPRARRKFLGGWAHDLISLIQAQGLSVRLLQEGGNPSDRALLDQMRAGMERIAFEATSFVEAAYACVGQPGPPTKFVVDELLRRATERLGDLVTVEPSQIAVEANAYAVARAVRDMVYVLLRAQVAKQLRITTEAARGRLTIEVFAGDGPVQPNAMRLREQLDSTFATLESLTGVVVSVRRDGRGVKAVFPVRQIGPSRPLVLVLARDPSITREVTRTCRGAPVDLQVWSSSVPILVALQELKSLSEVAACVIDASVSDDCTERLHQALRREPLRGRVLIVSDDTNHETPAPLREVAGSVTRSQLSPALNAALARAIVK